MIMQIAMPPELETRFRAEAERRGVSPDVSALRAMFDQLSAVERRAASIAILEHWAVTSEALTDADLAANTEVLRAIDAERPENNKLFPELAKDDRS